MSKERVSLDLDDEDTIDISAVANVQSKAKHISDQDKQSLKQSNEQYGFVSREGQGGSTSTETKPTPTKRGRRKLSPYTLQFTTKVRPEIKVLLQECSDRMNKYDLETLELAVLALIEKNNFNDLKSRYEEVVGKN